MPRQHLLRGVLQIFRLTLEVRARSASRFRCVARQFHAVDREHLAADQALRVANKKHLREHIGDVFAERADEAGDRREMRRLIAAEGDEGHVLPASPLDRPAADNAARIGEQDNLQQYGGWIGWRARLVISITGVKIGQVEFVIEQMIQRMLEGSRQQLPGEVNGEEAGIRVDCFVAGHRMFVFLNSDGVILSVPSTQGKMREYFFYNLVRSLPQKQSILHPQFVLAMRVSIQIQFRA
jgi:hypothetical protein